MKYSVGRKIRTEAETTTLTDMDWIDEVRWHVSTSKKVKENIKEKSKS